MTGARQDDEWPPTHVLLLALVLGVVAILAAVALGMAIQLTNTLVPAVNARVQQDLRGPVACRVVQDTIQGQLILSCLPSKGVTR